ncbi:enoyl-ACP reductase [Pelodictyon phaeoclathratiforme]|jgi:enoyl-[acyl-carrier protein] reductase I|uniref:Enoyl-[acyl-carrier-protein] reductase [NADH] n=1 Tax=Pelodictyon phaeoclathratiforme (strain DSM 5477 / BU-1) TaxID=324925 RepID=B4SDP3_PELPB|nr:enoyl-ACP reductase [Pelodictyon phaeoclathratiforme]ACF44411.1 enoyl-(acyl-carrier-protein) reductase (NADH) [Pelodictyon phaeoclathratiforme BU-1]MBV5289377.1 enoyl-ACP reductase [Pelodictyon phaeoclathratiforme]
MPEKAHYGLLKGKKGIVFGPLDESSIGWQIALHAYREGAEIAISNVAAALRFGNIEELSTLCGNAPMFVCDASKNEDVDACFKELKEKMGSVDFIVHSIGMSQNIRKQLPYEDLNYEWFIKTLDVSALSLHRLVSYALKNEAINKGGSILSLSYIASQRNYWTYSDMGDAKSLLESIVRSYGPRLARQAIRINTISQSPTYTKAGSGIPGFEKMYEYSDLMSPLGNASAEECAEYCMTILSDLSRKVTMQNLFHDGGYSSMGATIPMIKLAHEVLNDKELALRVGLDE